MSEIDLDEAFEQLVSEIDEDKPNLAEAEQTFVEAWLSKLKSVDQDEEKPLRYDYIKYLREQLDRDPKRLSFPFTDMPPDSNLPPLRDLLDRAAASRSTSPPERSRYFCSAMDKQPPCRPKASISNKRDRPQKKSMENEFQNPEEMAKCIARSKGMMLAEFVADISRHTADKGHELRVGMKAETTSFSEYVESIVTQRVKDIGDLLDDKQTNELLQIQKDYDKWQAELSICKKRLKEMVPEFEIDAYRKDKNYFKKIFSLDSSNPRGEDKLKEWKEQNCHRLMWFVNEIEKLTKENDKVMENISSIKLQALELERKETKKHECLNEYLQSETNKNKQLKQRRDKYSREIAELLLSLKN